MKRVIGIVVVLLLCSLLSYVYAIVETRNPWPGIALIFLCVALPISWIVGWGGEPPGTN